MVKLISLFSLFSLQYAVLADDTVVTTTANTDISTPIIDPWLPASSAKPVIQDLHREYSNIFRHGNRNAASHLWSNFLIQRANQMTLDRFEFFMSGYCAVSGSPVRPSDYTRYRLTLKYVGDTTKLISGFMYYCCWPCVCDTQDFIRVDTKNVTTVDGVERKMHFAVIGNPCDHPEALTEPFSQPASYGARTTTLFETAPEVRCNAEGKLEGAILSDHGYVIISMLFDATVINTEKSIENMENEEAHNTSLDETSLTRTDDLANSNSPAPWTTISSDLLPSWDGVSTPGRLSKIAEGVSYHDEREWAPMCKDRADNGFQSGMGEIFRRVSSISPIEIKAMEELGSCQDIA